MINKYATDQYNLPTLGPPIMVATFDKHSHLKYAATEINMTLLHVYLRFYPFDQSGTVLKRIDDGCKDCNSVHVNLIDNRLFLTAILDGCNFTLRSPSIINVIYYLIQTKRKIY